MTANEPTASLMQLRFLFNVHRAHAMLALVLLLVTKEASAQTDPCTNNELLELVDRGLRHPTNRISVNRGNICDYLVEPAVWYKLTSAVSYRMPEYCVPTFYCGTVSPIWLNGTHPTASNPGPVTLPICAVALDGACCGRWNGTVQVKYCPGNGPTDDSYVYQLQTVTICDSGYCAVARSDVTTTTTTTATTTTRPTTTSAALTTVTTTVTTTDKSTSTENPSTSAKLSVTGSLDQQADKLSSNFTSVSSSYQSTKTATIPDEDQPPIFIIIIAIVVPIVFLILIIVIIVIIIIAKRRRRNKKDKKVAEDPHNYETIQYQNEKKENDYEGLSNTNSIADKDKHFYDKIDKVNDYEKPPE